MPHIYIPEVYISQDEYDMIKTIKYRLTHL